ncbi:hypothetical protein Cgig2_011296 [Carnegiea gigantea]|uniref:Protein kinase domain-containing protein n=1 Tax=Carnegiea gigantea TaxID=171969 RepID=A0A9Q1GXA7_9CARY|nr:hypothetical protein Cgig2_011296 [Carnegiea gigantea]
MAVISLPYSSSFSLLFLAAFLIPLVLVRANTDANDVALGPVWFLGEMDESKRGVKDSILLGLFLLNFVSTVSSPCLLCLFLWFSAQALQVLYGALNNPPQLTGWTSSGSDPCGESWKGVKCDGSAVVSLDLSNNNLHDVIPFQLPPNLTTLNIAYNNLSGGLPYSISGMVALNYLNVSGNSLSQPIADVFSNHTALATLNVASNHFTGWIPQDLKSITNFVYDGNSFNDSPAPPPPPYIPPPPGRSSKRNHSHSGAAAHSPKGPDEESSHGNKKSSNVGTIVGIVSSALFLLLLGLLFLLFCKKKQKRKDSGRRISGQNASNGREKVDTEMQDQRVISIAAVVDVKTPPAENLSVDTIHGRNGSLKRMTSPITATSYTVATLQTATNSFSQENIVGEGSLGRVYKAVFSNGKVLAVKKIDNSALSLQEEDNFLEAVSNMSRLRHPNIVLLAGYCAEYGQRLLVYEYIGNGSLDDVLHFSEDGSERLTWNARVRVALGTARALEYLHEVCLPSVVHRNFKSANILLDEEFNPHLSDCGLAALTPNTERQVSTQMVGSFGYSAPEFALSGIYTTKSDVYSFGVVMLELLTGRKPLDSSRPRSEQSLVRWATPQLHDIDALAKMVDPALNGMYPAKSLSRFADIIALCVQPEPEFRPPISEVVQALVRLVQRAGVAKRRSSDDSGFGYKTPEHEAIDMPF